MDKICINSLVVHVCHGVNDDEKIKPQPFVFDIIIHANLTAARLNDDLSQTVNYAHAIKSITAEAKAESVDLIEHLAHKVAVRLLADFLIIQQVNVAVAKPRAPIIADFESVSVEISLARDEVL